jgi:hypothetical protein
LLKATGQSCTFFRWGLRTLGAARSEDLLTLVITENPSRKFLIIDYSVAIGVDSFYENIDEVFVETLRIEDTQHVC